MQRTTLTDPAAIAAELQARFAARKAPFPGTIAPCLTGNGHLLSVQASAFHYASPREDVGPYTHVEVYTEGYPGRRISALLRAIPGYPSRGRVKWSEPLGWVPVASVVAAIAADGGLVACVPQHTLEG